VAPDVQANGQPAPDIPGWEALPEDVRERLRKIRRDPQAPETAKVIKQVTSIRVGRPAADDIFRTHPDPVGWFDVNAVAIKKGFGQAGDKKLYLVGPGAMENVVVAQRARAGCAILTLTSEGVVAVWVLLRPNAAVAPDSLPYDQPKWDCAEAARADWVTFAWNSAIGAHQWSVVNLDGHPGAVPRWPEEHPLVLIDRAIQAVTVNDPEFAEFKNLMAKKASP
jgi:hypothetical protein